jgi:hypothetical protein
MLAVLIIVVVAVIGSIVVYFIYKNKKSKDSEVIPVPVPVPEPVPVGTKPTPPFPSCPFGPKPTDKSGLTSYLSRYISDPIVKVWIDWLAANPQDLDWVWSEYSKVNG